MKTGIWSGGEEAAEVEGVSLDCDEMEDEWTMGLASERFLRERTLRLGCTGIKLVVAVSIEGS